MELVLLTFGLLFAICRLGVRSASDHAGSYGMARYGDLESFKDRRGDKLMDDAIALMVRDEVLFDEVWDKIERSRQEYSSELYGAPFRERQIWDRLLSGGRRPLASYSCEFREKKGFKVHDNAYEDGHLTMTDSVNYTRAMHCLMWLQDKETETELYSAHIRVVKPGYEGPDTLVNFDEFEWQRKYG